MADHGEYERTRIARLNGVDVSQVPTADQVRRHHERARAADLAAIDAAVSAAAVRRGEASAAAADAIREMAGAEPVNWREMVEQDYQRHARGLYDDA